MKWIPLVLLLVGCATPKAPVDRVDSLIQSGDRCREDGDPELRDWYDTRKLNALAARRDFAIVENLHRQGLVGKFDYEQARRDLDQVIDHLETARDRLCGK